MNYVAATLLLSTRRYHRPSGAPSFLSRPLRWLDAWRDRIHLHALSNHTLRDMGFTRNQIDDVLRGAVRRARS